MSQPYDPSQHQQPPLTQPPGTRPTGFPPQGYRPPDDTNRSLAILAHLSAPIAAVISAGWLSMLGPLAVWWYAKDKDPFARRAAAGAFNFNLAFWVTFVVAWLLIFTLIGAVVGVPLLVIAFVVSAWCHIKGAIRSSRGEPYEYPFQIRVLS